MYQDAMSCLLGEKSQTSSILTSDIFADYQHRLYSREYEAGRYKLRKLMEEDDHDDRHHRPPEHRVGDLVRRYQSEPVLRVLLEILTEMGDLENIVDVLEAECEMRHIGMRREKTCF
jgi:hypothetical protein